MQEHYLKWYQTHAELEVFTRRVRRARQTLRQFLAQCAAPYVAFSGGKDSLATLILLAESNRTDVPVFTQADDLDWPEKRAFCSAMIKRLGFHDYTYAESTRSALGQFAALSFTDQDQIRGTFSHVWQRYVQKRKRSGVIMGLRSEESHARKMTRARQGLIYRNRSGFMRCLPIADWSGVDVFALIVSRGVSYMRLYDCDDECAPHELRMSWLLNPAFVDHGAAAFLRRHFPAEYLRLSTINPRLRMWA